MYGMRTVGAVVERQGLRRKGTGLEKMDKPFGHTCPFPSLTQKQKLCAQYRLRATPHHQRLCGQMLSSICHSHKINYTVPQNGLEQTYCSIIGKLRAPKEPHAFSLFPILPRGRGQQPVASPMLELLCRGAALLQGIHCGWVLACFSRMMRPL